VEYLAIDFVPRVLWIKTHVWNTRLPEHTVRRGPGHGASQDGTSNSQVVEYLPGQLQRCAASRSASALGTSTPSQRNHDACLAAESIDASHEPIISMRSAEPSIWREPISRCSEFNNKSGWRSP